MVVGEGVQREPPRNRFPLAVSFPHFFSAKRNGVARRRNALVLFPFPPAADNSLALCGFAFCLFYSLASPVASGGPLSLPPKKEAKETA